MNENNALYNEVESLIQKTVQTYDELISLLIEETNHIVTMNVKSLWLTTAKKKEITAQLDSLYSNFKQTLINHINNFTEMPKPFDIAIIIASLPFTPKEKTNLEIMNINIETKKSEIKNIVNSNHKCIFDYLGVIDGILSTIKGNVQDQSKSYSKQGSHVSKETQSFYGTKVGRNEHQSIISNKV